MVFEIPHEYLSQEFRGKPSNGAQICPGPCLFLLKPPPLFLHLGYGAFGVFDNLGQGRFGIGYLSVEVLDGGAGGLEVEFCMVEGVWGWRVGEGGWLHVGGRKECLQL